MIISMDKVIVFKDGIDLPNGKEDLTHELLAKITRIQELGRGFGLTLDVFEIYNDLVYFEWRGAKRDVLRFYTHYSETMTSESEETRIKTYNIILRK